MACQATGYKLTDRFADVSKTIPMLKGTEKACDRQFHNNEQKDYNPMKSDIIIQLHKNFEDYAHQIDGEEFWFVRNLQGLLRYSKCENFIGVAL